MDFPDSFHKWLMILFTVFIFLAGIGACGTGTGLGFYPSCTLAGFDPIEIQNILADITRAKEAGMPRAVAVYYSEAGCDEGCAEKSDEVPNCWNLCYACVEELISPIYGR